ncbi:hypothetical protein NPIL_279591, partial [Nephila pilipes]
MAGHVPWTLLAGGVIWRTPANAKPKHGQVDHRMFFCRKEENWCRRSEKESWGQRKPKYPVTSLRLPEKPKSIKSSDSSANLSESVKSLLKKLEHPTEEMSVEILMKILVMMSEKLLGMKAEMVLMKMFLD